MNKFLLLLIFVTSLVVQAEEPDRLGTVYLTYIGDTEKQFAGVFIDGKTRFRYEYDDNVEIISFINDLFENEEDYLLEIDPKNVIGEIIVEQRTITSIHLSDGGPTTSTNVQEYSEWVQLEEFAAFQYRLNRLMKISPKNVVDRILQDESLDERWKTVAKSCPQDEQSLGYSACDEVYQLEFRVFMKSFTHKKKIGEIHIETPYGC